MGSVLSRGGGYGGMVVMNTSSGLVRTIPGKCRERIQFCDRAALVRRRN